MKKKSSVIEIFIALRLLKGSQRNQFFSTLSLISFLGVFLGTSSLVVVLSGMSGFMNDLRTKASRSTPDITLERRTGDLIETEQLCQRILKLSSVLDCSAFISNEVIITNHNASNTSWAVLRSSKQGSYRAKDLEKQLSFGKISFLFSSKKLHTFWKKRKDKAQDSFQKMRTDFTKEEQFYKELDSNNPKDEFSFLKPSSQKKYIPGILLGLELSKTLSVQVGSVIKIVSPLGGSLTPVGISPRIKKFRVAGIFRTGMYEFDSQGAFLSLKEIQQLFRMKKAVNGIELKVKDPEQAPFLKKRVMMAIGGGPYRIQDWIDQNSRLFFALKLEKFGMLVVLVFVILVASFNIISTLFMVIVDKAQEIAILKAMGLSKTHVMKIMILQGMVIGFLGTTLGLFMGWRICRHFQLYPIQMNPDVYYIASIPFQINWMDYLLVGVISLSLCFLATIYPAQKASELEIVEGLKNE